ncbi:unnamed protein product [Acanthoscelides obtectus]|uniref:Uncharacterized protein n=1 Tax=Acanthoscelides obtectus TaxID=200917 RepID=A0A9P0KRZ5_ACAOB|nr:unnamed protein product [Acanthoscelides obtectus]CAK1678319.1 hypothetical protein AOBTE_LOCUS31819 [Acanthoscelides obtectus]
MRATNVAHTVTLHIAGPQVDAAGMRCLSSTARMSEQMSLSSFSTCPRYCRIISSLSSPPFDSSFCSMDEIILQEALLAPITFLYATDNRFRSSTVSSTSSFATFFIASTISEENKILCEIRYFKGRVGKKDVQEKLKLVVSGNRSCNFEIVKLETATHSVFEYELSSLVAYRDIINIVNHRKGIRENISRSPLEPYDIKYHVEIVSNLKDNFKNRFKDFNGIATVAQFVVLPFMEIDIQQFATSVTQNFSVDIAATEMEVIAFQNDLALKSLVSNTKCIWPSASKDKYSVHVVLP